MTTTMIAAPMTPPPPAVPSAAPPTQWSYWRNYESVALGIEGIPKDCNTKCLKDAFKRQGNVVSVDIFEDRHGRRSRRGRVRFSPPPETDFWSNDRFVIRTPSGRIVLVKLFIEPNHQHNIVLSLVQPGIAYPANTELELARVDFGVFLGDSAVCPMTSFFKDTSPKLILDARLKRLYIHFSIPVQVTPKPGKSPPLPYRVTIPFLQLTKAWGSTSPSTSEKSFITMLDSPPILHRKVSDDELVFRPSFNSSWRDSDSWYRQTSVVDRPWKQNKLKTKLQQKGQIIDIGRWNALEMTFPADVGDDNIQLFQEILKDHNITFRDGQKITKVRQRLTPVWGLIDAEDFQYTPESSTLGSSDWFGDMCTLETRQIILPFSTRYQLEVCISQNFLSEFTLNREFLQRLIILGEEQGTRLLEHVATQKRTYSEPMQIFSIKSLKGVRKSKIPTYCCYMRTARITPTTTYYNTPTVDISNRVTRRYREHADRFLRVRFTDEKSRGRINSSSTNTEDEIFTRVWRTLKNGIMIGDRHYEFLAFGNSQFREHGAYFFASLPHLTASHIRAWMGQFSHIRNVAKHASRIGQCFSTTRAVVGCPVETKPCDEVSRNGNCFSDGVGKISIFLAQMTMNELKVKTPTGTCPSAYQFRLGGSKGMLVVSDDPNPKEIHIRPSQRKFNTEHSGLEIIRCSQFSVATLNRQLILVLSALGIPDENIRRKLNMMLENVENAMQNDRKVIELLQRFIDPNQVTLSLAQMVSNGFRRTNEPFVNSLLALWKSWHLKHVKEKARIVIDKGANLLGCLDEAGVLKGYFNAKIPASNASYEEKVAGLPEIFVQISRLDEPSELKIIEGICILARNPSLHPGDIRVVRAVNRPELRHLSDVVVFPQTGDKDIASMCSGGDLDGDDYFVIWDQDLIPKDWFVTPMEYTSRKAPDLPRDVTVHDITSFFVTYMKNDSLPRIAHAHMALADRLQNGVLESKCIRLAQLHSDAVDYNKTGASAVMTRDLEPRMWPHFMEKRHKRPEQIYHSEKILGQLYDAVQVPDFAPNLSLPFDSRILNSPLVPASLQWTELATQLKAEYDAAMRRVMTQYDIKTEFEVWSAFVLSHNQLCRDYHVHEELGRMNSILRDGFRQQCYDKVSNRSMESFAPFVVAMYRVTSEEVKLSLQETENKKILPRLDDDESVDSTDADTPPLAPLISFPWIFQEILAKVAHAQIKAQDPNKVAEVSKMYSHDEVVQVLDQIQNGSGKGLIVEEGPIRKVPAPDIELGWLTRDSDSKDADLGIETSNKEANSGDVFGEDIFASDTASKDRPYALDMLLALTENAD